MRRPLIAVGLVLFGSLAIAAPDPYASRKGATGPAPATPDPAGSGYHGLGAGSISAEDVAKFAAPALPREISGRIQSLLDVRGPGSGILTAKGDRMVFTSRVTGSSQVWRQDGPLKLAVQLTGGEDTTTAVGLAPDGSFVVVSRDVGGEENPGLYLTSLDGGPLRLVQHTPHVQTALQLISDDSKTLYYTANDVDPASYALYRYDVAAGTRTLVFDTPGLWSIADSRGDAWLLVKELGNAHQEIYAYDAATKKLDPLLGQNESEEYAVAFGARPGQVLVRTNKLGDFQRLYSLEHGQLTPVSPETPHDVSSFGIDHARKRIYVATSEDGYAKLAALDATTGKPLALPKLPDADNVRLSGLSRDGRFVQLSVDGATLAPQSMVYDWQTKKLTTWRVASTPEVDVGTFAKVALETYPARDGTKIPMFVRRPASCASAAAPCPVVVMFHGGPEGQATAGFSTYAQMFVDAGFVLVQPNVRGSLGYGKAWLHADDAAKRLDVITDIEDCALHLRKAWAKGGVAPKVGVTGGSYGGYSTLMAMTYFAGAYDAGVAEVGISNLVTFLQNTAPYRRILRTSEYGDPEKDHDALVKLSPITHVAKLRAPLLLIQGVNDPRVPVNEAVQIYRELERRKVPGGLILFPDEGHGTAKRGNEVLAIGHTIAFLKEHLK